jgi:outer membrane protein OmpA-like peptidoglycan-associated protein
MKNWIFAIFLIAISTIAIAQEYQPVGFASDIKDAITIQLSKQKKYVCSNPPLNAGVIKDYSNENKKFPYLISKEKHSAWYYVEIPYTAILTFKLKPLDSLNDYDFAFFKVSNKTTIQQDIYTGLVKPEVSCLSRNTPQNGGITGMMFESENASVTEGPGKQFVKPINVNKGEIWLLYIDNNTSNGKGFKLIFELSREVKITGKVTDSEHKNGIAADVSIINDATSEVIAKTTANDSGIYELKVPVSGKANYSMFFYNGHFFFNSQTLKSSELTSSKEVKINTQMSELEAGKTYQMQHINFYGDQAVVLPTSVPVMMKLLLLMQQNNKLEIRICGHVNGCHKGEEFGQTLSDDRAKTIYDFLISHHTDKSRLSTIGFGCKKMLFPNPNNEVEMEANRRVEIEVVKF